MAYLMTGGSGLIGKALIKRLLNKNEDITVITRDVKKTALTLGTEIKLESSLSNIQIEDYDIVINLAGEPIADKRWSKHQKSEICQSRWDITKQLATLIQESKAPPKLMISGSAIGIYGRQGDQVIDEAYDDYHPEFTHKVCEQWESLALKASSNKTRVAILRTGIVLSKHGGALKKMIMPFKLGLGGKLGTGSQIMSWIHIEDLVSAIVHIKDNPSLLGPINITSQHSVSNEVFSQCLAHALNRPCFLSTPKLLLKVMLGEMSDILIHGQNVAPKKLLDSKFSFEHSTLENALKDLLVNE